MFNNKKKINKKLMFRLHKLMVPAAVVLSSASWVYKKIESRRQKPVYLVQYKNLTNDFVADLENLFDLFSIQFRPTQIPVHFYLLCEVLDILCLLPSSSSLSVNYDMEEAFHHMSKIINKLLDVDLKIVGLQLETNDTISKISQLASDFGSNVQKDMKMRLMQTPPVA